MRETVTTLCLPPLDPTSQVLGMRCQRCRGPLCLLAPNALLQEPYCPSCDDIDREKVDQYAHISEAWRRRAFLKWLRETPVKK